MNVQPLPDRLIVKLDERRDRTLGGLFVRDTSQPIQETGVVLAVALNERRIRAGDRVIFPYGSGQAHTIDGQEVVGLKRESLWGILE